MVKNLCKKLTPGFKNHMRNLDNFRQAVVQKVEIQWATFVKKFIPSAETLYKEGLSNITINYLCENSPHSLCHFWNYMSFFTTQLVYIILAQTLYAIDKSSTSKSKFSDLPLLALKFKTFIMSFLKPKASVSSNFASLSSVMRDNSSILFHLKLYVLSRKGTHQVQIFTLSTARMKINQIPRHFPRHESVFI